MTWAAAGALLRRFWPAVPILALAEGRADDRWPGANDGHRPPAAFEQRGMKRSVLGASDAARDMMASLGLVGSFDIRADGSRSTGWVGKPGEGDDVAIVITINPLPSMPPKRVRPA